VSESGRSGAGQGLGRRGESWHSRRTGMIVVGLIAGGGGARAGRRHSVGCCLSR